MTVKERPILMTGSMVRATLDDLKTNTRRLRGLEDVNAYPGRLEGDGPMGPLGYRGLCESDLYIRQKRDFAKNPGLYHWFLGQQGSEVNPIPVKCPYGKPGDRLWVRETFWRAYYSAGTLPCGEPDRATGGSLVHYSADGPPPNTPNRFYPNGLRNGSYSAPDPYRIWHQRPSIHMPRWACRLTLEIVSVRVERLQTITEEGALSEGIRTFTKDGKLNKYWALDPCDLPKKDPLYCTWADMPKSAVEAFRVLWTSLNGQQSWDANPFVWAVEFRRPEVQP